RHRALVELDRDNAQHLDPARLVAKDPLQLGLRVLTAQVEVERSVEESCQLLASQAPPGPAAVPDRGAASWELLRSGLAAAPAVGALFLAPLVERALSRRPVVCFSSESTRLSNSTIRSARGSISRI